MTYEFRVTLPGIKGFYRRYKVNPADTLYSFHKQLRSDLEFPTDQPILFKAMGDGGAVLARYALVDLGYGMVDEVSIENAVKAGAGYFEYFYDTKAGKKIIITLEQVWDGENIKYPTMLPDAKGPVPAEFDNGYVAFEDLPKDKRKMPGEGGALAALLGGDDGDDDEEEDDEEEDDDKPEEIYDENE